MEKLIGMAAVLLALFVVCAANAAMTISTVGDGSGYDETTQPGFRSTDVIKSFDVDGDNIYGTEGLFFFGDGGSAGNGLAYSRSTQVGAEWAAFSAGKNWTSVSVQSDYGPYDNPTLSGAVVADWGNQGIGTAGIGVLGGWSEILTFTVDATTPQQFRIGIMSGTQQDTNGRWDPTGLRLSVDGGTTAAITGLANNENSNPEWVFFDVDLNGESSGTFSIEGQQRLSTQGIGISGVTFDAVPTDAPTAFIHYRGIDTFAGGSYRSTSVDKILMADGDAVYGTDGHLFFNVTPLGGTGAGNQPALSNAVQVVPSYVSAITPAAGVVSARDYGYLAIDDPTAPVTPVVADVESGLLVAGVGDDAGTLHVFLSVEFNGLIPANGVRFGVLVDNADGAEFVPESLRLGATAASAESGAISSDSTGRWVFFDLDAAASNQTVTLYGTKGASNPMTIGGVVFDSISSALPEINVFTAAHTDTEGVGVLGWSAAHFDELSIFDQDGLPIAGASGALGKQEIRYSGGEIYTLMAGNAGTRIIETRSTPTSSGPVAVGPGTFTYSGDAPVADDGTSVVRRDPSDVIKVGDTWHIWYSRVLASSPLYPSGYDAAIWHSTSTDGGHSWVEQGEAVPRGAAGEWDAQSVFTPNIVFHDNTYYLYFTGIWNSDGDGTIGDEKTAIGVATSSSPYGPWTKYSGNPVLETSSVASQFDSFRVDDACMAVRNGKVWFYYKGRSVNGTNTDTKMGVAVASSGVGPFVRQNGGNPVQLGGHEVQIWVDENEGVFSMVNSVAPANLKNTIQYAANGVNFEKFADLTAPIPEAPGLYRPELTDPTAGGQPDWGIDGIRQLGRYEIDINLVSDAQMELDPTSIVEGNRLNDLIGSLSISGGGSGSGYTYELLPIVNTNAFRVANDAVSANQVFDASVTNRVGLFVRAEADDADSVDAFFDVDVLEATGSRKWRLGEFGADVLEQPDLESTVWGDSANPDGDEFSNIEEYLADTLPQDSKSVLRIESLTTHAGNFELRWMGGVNATQYIESCDALTSNSIWTVVATNLPPTAVSNVWNGAIPVGTDSGMYRIKVER